MVTKPFLEGKRLALIVIATALIACFISGAVIGEHHSGKYKRMIAEGVGEKEAQIFKEKGCLMRHHVRGGLSFDCPEEIAPEINAREARVFYVTDLTADRQTEADKVWLEGITGKGVKVAVLDTGIDTDHPELFDSYYGGYDFVNMDDLPEDDHGHGTHVAGIIAANGANSNAKGVAPDARIYMFKVCNAQGACYEDDMIAAMETAMIIDPDVMSISIGGGSYTTENCDSDALAAEVNKVADSGVTVVIAAGNDGRGVSSPACASKAIAVGAVDSSNNVAYFSGRGNALDIVAPGVSIYSSYLNGGYAYMSGTSMSTPHLAGVVALLLEANKSLTTAQIKDALYTTTNPVNKCYGPNNALVTCTRDITGAGVVDAYKAYLKVKATTPPQPECTVNADCSSLSNQCNTGVCDENLGKCVAQPKTDGTSCSDGLYCNGAETCKTGACVKGVSVTCSEMNNQCNTGICDENTDQCIAQKKPDGTTCNDGLYCNTGETCQQGTCKGGSAFVCNDGVSCTADKCNENTDSCVYTWPSCGIADGCCASGCSGTVGSVNYDADCQTSVKCWSSGYRYLFTGGYQARKFCKCAMGTYGYSSYSYNYWSRTTTYGYTDTNNNNIWTVQARGHSSPTYQVKCPDGKWYVTSKDYFR